MPCLVTDFRAIAARSESADVVLVADNSLPHLLSEAEIAAALAEYFRCARPGGGCLITMRDYGIPPPPGTREVHPFGERAWRGHRFHVRQVWTWRDRRYDLALKVTPLDAESGDSVPVLETSYFAITLEEVAELMRGAGFERVERVDGRFFQPVLMGTRPRAA